MSTTATNVVLVVEDEPLVRMVMHDTLSEAGYHVLEAANSDEALAFLHARFDIALALADIDMPGTMNGISLAWQIRSHWPTILIILTSGKTILTAREVPEGTVFLQKPYGPDALVAAVAAKLGPAQPEEDSIGTVVNFPGTPKAG
jgi:two-component system, response regulator PdtaR